MSIVFKSYEERVENKNGEIKKTSKMTTHNGKKGIEVITKNGKTSQKKFKVNSKNLSDIRKTVILPSILVSVPMHKVIKTKNMKSKKSLKKIVKSKRFKTYMRTMTKKRRKSRLKKTRKKSRKKSIKRSRKKSIKKSFWNKLIGR
jgi:hypothetical protein